MPVFEIVSGSAKETAAEVAAAFGQNLPADADENQPPDVEPGSYVVTIQEGDEPIEIDASADGAFALWYRDREPIHTLKRLDAEAPGIDEVIAVAEQFLEEHPGLLPEGWRLTAVAPGEVSIDYQAEAGEKNTFLRSREVVYRRFWDGLSEGRFSITVNTNGDVYSVTRSASNLRVMGDYPVLGPGEAFQLLNSERLRNFAGDEIAGGLRIERAEVEYWGHARPWEKNILQPIYRFHGSMPRSDGERQTFMLMVPAVRPEYLQ